MTEFIIDDRIEQINWQYFQRRTFIRFEIQCRKCGYVFTENEGMERHICDKSPYYDSAEKEERSLKFLLLNKQITSISFCCTEAKIETENWYVKFKEGRPYCNIEFQPYNGGETPQFRQQLTDVKFCPFCGVKIIFVSENK